MSQNYAKYKHFLISTPAPYVAHVQINRPQKLNAFFEAMWLELDAIFKQLSTDSEIRAVVLSGAGEKAFTAGLDVEKAGTLTTGRGGENVDASRRAVEIRRHAGEFQDCVTSVEKCEKPVICVMHGYAYGLGLDIATCADIRLCAASTKFAVKEVDIGLAADVGTLSRLPKVVGSFGWVKDVTLTARPFDSEEAFRVGFVQQVLGSKEEAIKEAIRRGVYLASKSPVAVQGTKDILNHARDHSVADNLRYTAVWNSAAIQSSDVERALLSGLQKRTPTFEKL